MFGQCHVKTSCCMMSAPPAVMIVCLHHCYPSSLHATKWTPALTNVSLSSCHCSPLTPSPLNCLDHDHNLHHHLLFLGSTHLVAIKHVACILPASAQYWDAHSNSVLPVLQHVLACDTTPPLLCCTLLFCHSCMYLGERPYLSFKLPILLVC